MFVQVIQGRAKDAAGLRKQFDRWSSELKPGATGWLGSTAGVSDDGEFIALARFESEEAARRNSDRPEQGQWWAETEKFFEGDVMFHDCPRVETFLKGGSDDAGFVQIIQGHVSDIDEAIRLTRQLDESLPKVRGDVIGGTTAYNPNGRYTEAVYFTSEAEARDGERKMGESEESQARLKEMEAVSVEEPKYIDLRDPWLLSP
jgi:nucleoid-associated protein YgaU